jgi:hypothetical protein
MSDLISRNEWGILYLFIKNFIITFYIFVVLYYTFTEGSCTLHAYNIEGKKLVLTKQAYTSNMQNTKPIIL